MTEAVALRVEVSLVDVVLGEAVVSEGAPVVESSDVVLS